MARMALVCSTAIMASIPVGAARATCVGDAISFSTDTPLDKRISDFRACIIDEQGERIGKYFCFIDRMAGIQKNEDGTIYSGKITSENDKFFVEIRLVDDYDKRIRCEYGDYGIDFMGGIGNLCMANFDILIDGKETVLQPSADSYRFSGNFGDFFLLTGVGTFTRFENHVESQYVSAGKCQKID